MGVACHAAVGGHGPTEGSLQFFGLRTHGWDQQRELAGGLGEQGQRLLRCQFGALEGEVDVSMAMRSGRFGRASDSRNRDSRVDLPTPPGRPLTVNPCEA